MGITGTEIISPILDKRKGGKPHHTDYYSPQEMSAEPVWLIRKTMGEGILNGAPFPANVCGSGL